MKSISPNTAGEKTLFYLNLISIVGDIILLILLPSVGLLAGLRFILWVGSIALTVLNVLFYIAPQNYKLTIVKKRLLFVYLPAAVICIFALFDLLYFIINLQIFAILSILFSVCNFIQAGTFAILVSKLATSAGPLLG